MYVNNEHGLPWIKINDVKSKYVEKTEQYFNPKQVDKTLFVDCNSLIYTIEGSPCIPFFIKFDAAIDNHLALVKTSPRIDIDFSYYLLTYLRKYFSKFITGSSLVSINIKHILQYNTFLPDIREQQEIATLLTLLDKQIELWERKLQLYELVRIYFLNLLFKKYKLNTSIINLVTRTNNINKMDIQYRNGCISKIFGVSFQDSFFKKEIKSKKQTSHKILYKDEYVYNPARVNIGSIARNKYKEPLLFSPMYETFKLIDIQNINILDMYFESHIFINECKKLASGSVRRTLNWDDFLSIKIFDIKKIKYDHIHIIILLKNNIKLIKDNIKNTNIKKLFYLHNLFK